MRVLSAEYQQFFCRYSDPSYIKTVKLEILTAITTEVNRGFFFSYPVSLAIKEFV